MFRNGVGITTLLKTAVQSGVLYEDGDITNTDLLKWNDLLTLSAQAAIDRVKCCDIYYETINSDETMHDDIN